MNIPQGGMRKKEDVVGTPYFPLGPNKFESIRYVLGGSQVIQLPLRSDIDLINLAKMGLKRASLISLGAFLGLGIDELSPILRVSTRTLQRKGADLPISIDSSEQAIEVASLVSMGIQVFGSEEKFQTWLNSPLLSLDFKRPVDFLDTTLGVNMLEDELIRLEQGVFS